MKLISLVVLSTMLLVGCGSELPVRHEAPKIHPSWPDPIKTWNGKWQVKVIDGQAWVGMPFEESQEFRGWLNDVTRYTKDSNKMICYYRMDLKEPKCL